MKKLFIIIFLLLPVALLAQNITNVTATPVGDKIEISYDMDAPLSSVYMEVNVYCSTDGGATFGEAMQHVSGDVFDKAKQGHNKAVWDFGKDVKEIKGDNIVFEARVEMQKTIDFVVNGVTFKMIYVEGGTFTMGCTSEQGGDCYDDEKPTHQVTLSGYYMGETEVTQALWEAVMGSNPSYFKGSDRPVENVSWDDVQVFLRKLNQLTGKTFRLPTEAEWEYAVRGGNKSKGYKYAGSNSIGEVAWYTVNCYDKGSSHSDYGTHPVKGKRANELGLYGMSGNVWEWCSDWYGSYSSSSQTNPTGAYSGSRRVDRGGSWGDYARYCRSTYRCNDSPGSRYYILGFRLSLSK